MVGKAGASNPTESKITDGARKDNRPRKTISRGRPQIDNGRSESVPSGYPSL
jgi:hypothetical protein